MAKSIIKESNFIRACLQKRIKLELDLTLSQVHRDAKEKGMEISISSLSKYMNNVPDKTLTEEKILWLCMRYGIPVSLSVGKMKIDTEGRTSFTLPDFDEEKILAKLYEKHPWPKKD